MVAKLDVKKFPCCVELIRQPFEMDTNSMKWDEPLEDSIGNSDVDENIIAFFLSIISDVVPFE